SGIPEEDLPYVFDRFYKSDKSRGLDKTGVGLGLYIARTIIEAHKEKIWVESEYGKWCRFSFTLTKTLPAEERMQNSEFRMQN
ncbi:MAG: sensor histidine kinase, partial [Clostridia bacterium]|nr:sensor histidine kinase [Clostridia bacterium]